MLELDPLQRIRIRPDGGITSFLHRTDEVWPPSSKYLGALTNTIVLGYNLALLSKSANIAINDILVPLMFRDYRHHQSMHIGSGQDKSLGLHFLTGQVGYLDFGTRRSLVAIFEVVGLMYYSVSFTRLLVYALSYPRSDSQAHECWHAVAEIFWSLQPSMRCFSAMRMLKKVHPHVLNVEVRHMLNRIQKSSASPYRRLLRFILFFVKRALLLYFGFQAFLYKFTVTADSVHSGKLGPVSQIAMCLGFLNQLVGGIVQLDILLKQRIMLLLFGGEDVFMDSKDSVVMSMWLARLAKAIHTRSFVMHKSSYSDLEKTNAGSRHRNMDIMLWWCRLRFFISMSTWNHLDFQKLILEDRIDIVQERNTALSELGKRKGWEHVVQRQPYFEFQ